MDLNTYQERAMKTRIPSAEGWAYSGLGLAGEAGEVANKLKKILRGDAGVGAADVAKELGGVLWYLSAVATDFGLSLGDIATSNLDQLESRQARGVIQGSGDDR